MNATTMTEAIIRARHLARTYVMGEIEVHALRGASFEIERGEFVAIMGPSGSGKTTLMNLIGCLDTPTSGEYLLDGLRVDELDGDMLAWVRNRKIGFVFQQFNLLARLTALDNVELPLVYAGGMGRDERQERAYEALCAVGLEDRIQHHPQELSGGQQQRVAIARALATRPAILLADEPTGNLDSRSSEELLVLFNQLNHAGRTIIIVTHEHEVARHANRVLTLRDRLLSEDTGDAHARPSQPDQPEAANVSA